MLKLQFKDKSREPVWIVENNYTIGTATEANLTLNDPELAPHHAQLLTRDNQLIFKSLVSHPPCTLNGQLVGESEVRPGDSLVIGDVELLILHPHESISQVAVLDEQLPQWSLIASSSWLNGREFTLSQFKALIGRGSHCDIVIPGTHLSRQHAELEIKGNQLLVRDLASANGTYLNNKRITEAFANPGDELRFDIYPFRIKGPNTDHNKTRVRSTPERKPIAPVKVAKIETKQWKTKPTSPGNREEPKPQQRNKIAALISLLLCLFMLLALIYLGLI